jgi:hypothetical protein
MESARSTQPTSRRPGYGELIFATKRRARQHKVLVAVAVIVVGGGGAAGGILASGTPYAATRPMGAALVKSPLFGAGQTHGRALVQLGVPTILRFAPGATFAIAVIVTNRAAAPITLQRARVILPGRSPLRQIGTRLIPFKPIVCPPGEGCPYHDPIGPGPYGVAARPVPLSVAPGHEVLAQVHFQLASCWSKALRARAMPRKINVVYRSTNGKVIHQLLQLGDSTPQLTGVPARPTCRS